MRVKEGQRGITLVALIITIIILIILAAVTINSVLKFNIVNRAVEGAEKYAEAQEGEKKQFDELADKLEEYIGRIEKKAVILTIVKQEETKVSVVSTGIKEGDEIQSYTFQKSETGEEDFDEGTKIETKDTKCEYTYEGIEKDKTYYLRVVVTYESGEKKYSNIVKIGGASGGQEGTGEEIGKEVEPTEADIGKYVNYIPNGEEYIATSDISGYSKEIFGVANNQRFETETDIKWRIWSVENNTLKLISNRTTNNSLTLGGFQGCNNAIWLLNKICSSNYGNNNYNGLVARSLKISDVENVTKYNFKTGKYGSTITCTAENAYYPNVWNEIDRQDSTMPYNTRSEQNKTYTGRGGGNSSTTFRHTMWGHEYTAENKNEEWINPKYYELICSPDISSNNFYKGYWLASRSVNNESSWRCIFGIQNIYSGFVGASENCWSNNLESYGISGLRPIIEIPLTSLELTTSGTAGIDFEIQPK